MSAAIQKAIACCLLFGLAAEGTCMADTKRDATVLYAITDSLSLNDKGTLCYSRLEDGRRTGLNSCPSRPGTYYCLFPAGSGRVIYFDSAFSSHLTVLYDDLWFSFIEQYELLSTTIKQLLDQFNDIAQRLGVLNNNRKKLLAKYGQYREESFLEPIDGDIKYLSSLGVQLRDVSRRFFAAIKPKVIDAEIEKELLQARTEGMRGLTTFERELQGVTAMPGAAVDRSLEQIVAAVDQAVAELERAIAE